MKNQLLIVSLTFFVLGLALVIAGALFKVEHYSAGNIDGNLLLVIGMAVEAVSMLLIGFSIYKVLENKK